jgi:hypothetical protein
MREQNESSVENKQKKKQAAPFGHAEHDVHPDVPGEWAHRADVAVQPLLEVAIVDVLVHKYPENTSNRRTDYHKKQMQL